MKMKWGDVVIEAVRGDITRLDVDAIVNAANSRLEVGGGVDGAIHRAGGPEILRQCQQWVAEHGRLPAGAAMMTSGGALKARHVIHTVGPVWKGGGHGEAEALRGCYRGALELADGRGLKSVAFPSISTGVYGYPFEAASREAFAEVKAVVTAQKLSVQKIIFVLFSEADFACFQKIIAAEFN